MARRPSSSPISVSASSKEHGPRARRPSTTSRRPRMSVAQLCTAQRRARRRGSQHRIASRVRRAIAKVVEYDRVNELIERERNLRMNCATRLRWRRAREDLEACRVDALAPNSQPHYDPRRRRYQKDREGRRRRRQAPWSVDAGEPLRVQRHAQSSPRRLIANYSAMNPRRRSRHGEDPNKPEVTKTGTQGTKPDRTSRRGCGGALAFLDAGP